VISDAFFTLTSPGIFESISKLDGSVVVEDWNSNSWVLQLPHHDDSPQTRKSLRTEVLLLHHYTDSVGRRIKQATQTT
jgi:hypothetical protein